MFQRSISLYLFVLLFILILFSVWPSRWWRYWSLVNASFT